MSETIRNTLVTVNQFSKSGIIFTSRKGMLWYQVLSAILGAFLIVYSTSLLWAPQTEGKSFFLLLLLAGLALLYWPLSLRNKANEISFDMATRQISGLQDCQTPVKFSDVSCLELTITCSTCNLIMVLTNRTRVCLFKEFPLYVAIRIGSHLSDVIGIPLHNDKGKTVAKSLDDQWKLPCKFPSAKFPFHLILSGVAFGAVTAIITFFHPENITLIDVILKLLFFPVAAFVTSITHKTVFERFGFMAAMYSLFGLIMLFILISVWSFVEPALSFAGAIVAFAALFYLVKVILEKDKNRTKVTACIAVTAVGLMMILVSSISYHSFFSMKPSSVDRIMVKINQNVQEELSSPEHIESVLHTLQTAAFYRLSEDMPTRSIVLHIIGYGSRTYVLTIHQEGFGSQARIVYKLSLLAFQREFYFGKLVSSHQVFDFYETGSLYGFWPPGY